MGKDLYYMQTPKLEEEKYYDLEYSTWHFLANLWNIEVMDVNGRILDKSDEPPLKIVMATAKSCNNERLAKDIEELINAINKMESITLVIRD